MLNTLAIIAALLVGASEPPAGQRNVESPEERAASAPLPPLHVSIRTGRDRYEARLDMATGEATRLDTLAAAPIVIPLPGTDLSAELLRPSAIPYRDLYVVQRAEDGSEVKRTLVCPFAENPRDAAWHVGWQRLIYIRGVGAAATLRSLDPRTGDETTLPVEGTIDLVRVSTDGQIGVVTTTARDGKERSANLVVFRGRAMGRAIVRGQPISTFAWTSDGMGIIYGVPGELRRHDFLGDGTPEVVKLGELDAKLVNHVAHSIDIAPDGTIALVMRFAGGRASIGPGPHELPGDHDVYLLDWPDRLRSFQVIGDPVEVRWVR